MSDGRSIIREDGRNIVRGGLRVIGVKLTILLIVVMIIYRSYVRLLLSREDGVTQYMAMNGKAYRGRFFILGLMRILVWVGIIYSAIYLLFFS